MLIYSKDLLYSASKNPGILAFGTRIKTAGGIPIATVVGQANGVNYAVVDAQYRVKAQMSPTYYNGTNPFVSLPVYSTEAAAVAAEETAKNNTDIIIANNTQTNAPGAYAARNCGISAKVKGVIYQPQLPTLNQLRQIWLNRQVLDTYDTTVAEYSANSLTVWNIQSGGTFAWSSTSKGYSYDGRYYWLMWRLSSANAASAYYVNYAYGIIPVIEIPILAPQEPLIESSEAGSGTLTVPESGVYELEIYGGGGNGSYATAIGGPCYAGGGSGAGFKGFVYLNAGTYPYTIGGANTASVFNSEIIAGGGGNGSASAYGYVVGTAGVISVNMTSSTLISASLQRNGNAGTGNFGTDGSGGASLSFDGWGAGGGVVSGVGESGVNGYLKITYERENI